MLKAAVDKGHTTLSAYDEVVMRSIVITGAAGGIGCATAKLLVENGCRVFGGVRNAAQAARLADIFPHRFVPLIFDVRDEAAVTHAAEQVRCQLQGKTLDGLINNAATALPGPLLHQSLDEIRGQLETNLLGAVIVAKAFVPLLGVDHGLKGSRGKLINMSSICGKLGTPFAAAYCASKYGLEGFSESLRRELKPYGISVIIVAPGQVKTSIWERAARQTAGRYDTTPFAWPFRKGASILVKVARNHGLEPSRVAETIWHALTSEHPRARYAPSRHPILEQGLARLMPRRLMDHIIDRRLSLSERLVRYKTNADELAGSGTSVSSVAHVGGTRRPIF
jgi:NAD(P)-dependent dehydrogenase (short-subunit alcohol dehydrogenase family)